MIDDLCAARLEDTSAIEHAQALATAAQRPYSEAKMREFCDAGDRMQIAHARKMIAWDRIRDSSAASMIASTSQVTRFFRAV